MPFWFGRAILCWETLGPRWPLAPRSSPMSSAGPAPTNRRKFSCFVSRWGSVLRGLLRQVGDVQVSGVLERPSGGEARWRLLNHSRVLVCLREV